MQFEAGATYSVSYDVMAGRIVDDTETVKSVTIHSDPRYDDPAQYGKKNPDDHINVGKVTVNTNTAKWTNVSYEFTVNPDSFLKTNVKGTYTLEQETFRIYSNPVNSKSVQFYIDNLIITKKTPAKLSVSGAVMSDGVLTVSGDTGRILQADENILLGLYDKDGRMLDMRMINCRESKDFSEVFENASAAVTVKVKGFFWTGLRRFIPVSECVTAGVTK